MTHISRRKLSKKTEIEILKSFQVVIKRISLETETESFLSSIMSDTEKLMIAKRLAIIVLLNEKIPETEIANSIHVTRETVRRTKLLSEIKGAGYSVAIKILEDEKMLSNFKNILLSLTKYSVKAAGGRVSSKIFE